jgi:hypothetical protein
LRERERARARASERASERGRGRGRGRGEGSRSRRCQPTRPAACSIATYGCLSCVQVRWGRRVQRVGSGFKPKTTRGLGFRVRGFGFQVFLRPRDVVCREDLDAEARSRREVGPERERGAVVLRWGLRFSLSHFGFRVPDFGSRVSSGSGFRISGLGFRVSGVSGLGSRVSGFGYKPIRVSGALNPPNPLRVEGCAGFRVSGLGYKPTRQVSGFDPCFTQTSVSLLHKRDATRVLTKEANGRFSGFGFRVPGFGFRV